MPIMSRLPILLLVLLVSQSALAQQPERLAFHALMAMAKIKKVVSVDTAAGPTRVLITSAIDNPAYVFTYAPGGEGTLVLDTDAQGAPVTKRPRVPIYPLAPAFLEKNAAWAAIDVPESYGIAISREARQEQRHVEAITNALRRVREEFPMARHILVGHSNGGISAAMQSVQEKPPIDAIVFSAPNISAFPTRWEPAQAKVPVKFIVHANDDCGASPRNLGISTRTQHMAGRKFPLTVIRSPSPGSYTECFSAPAPHFFTNNYEEYASAIMKWASTLK